MNRIRASFALLLLAVACGHVTSLGDEKGSGGKAGTGLDGGVGTDASTGGLAGAGGSAGSAGGTTWDGASGTCNVAPPPPLQNPTPEEQARANLIHDFCTAVVQQCADNPPMWLHVQGECSPAELVLGCEEDTLEGYLLDYASCDAEWTKAIGCGTNATYETVSQCGAANIGTSGSDVVCGTENAALNACAQLHVDWTPITGTKTTCHYGPSLSSPCAVDCTVGSNQFSLFCFSKLGLPLQCGCVVNGNLFNSDWDFPASNIYATDCAAAAALAANGEKCTNRLDCCFAYKNGDKDVCQCGSDPKLLDMPSCQAAADFAGGTVVDICPQYEPGTGNCWPPPCG